MRILVPLLLAFITVAGIAVYSGRPQNTNSPLPQPTSGVPEPTGNLTDQSDEALTTVVATGLDTPWAIAFLPQGSILVTERPGRVRRIDAKGTLDPNPVATLTQVKEIGEGGLLGLTLHPDFSTNNFVYLYYTYNSSGNDTSNRVVRMTYTDNQLTDETVIIDRIPASANHNGGRIQFGPDKMLYVTTGDAQEPSRAQDTNSLSGKILRMTDTGHAAPNSPFTNLIYSYGHRNPQGLAWDSDGRLWSTEHGRSGVQSGLDEVNLIEAGKNYGWPEIAGDEQQQGMETPKLHSGSSTWAPAGAAVIGQSLFFGGLRGQTLYEAVISGDQINLREHVKGELGRIREVVRGPDGMLYITTSNRDGRGTPGNDDDRVIRVNTKKLP